MGAKRELKSRPSLMMLLGIGCETMGAAMRARTERQMVRIIVEAFIVTGGVD
jgi:hypothetical protein